MQTQICKEYQHFESIKSNYMINKYCAPTEAPL